MNGKTQPVDMSSFERVVDSHDVVLLDFWAGWCKPCQQFDPVYESLAEAHPEIYFGKVDVEKAPDLAEAFQVRGIPTLMAFKKSELVFEHSGLIPVDGLEQLISKLKEA